MNRLQENMFQPLNARFDSLNEIVLQQLRLTRRLIEGGATPASRDEVDRNERQIDALEVALREEVINVIVLHAPRASYLRSIIACYDTTSNLERVGDLILNIDEFTREKTVTSELYQRFRPDLIRMFDAAADMVKNAIFALRSGDERMAREVIRADDTVDNARQRIDATLQRLPVEGGEAANAEVMLCIFGIANNLERIGDQATNIAEAMIYAAEGRDIKHCGRGQAEG